MTAGRPIPESKRVAAQYRLGVISSEEVKAFASACLDAGQWSVAIDDIVMSPYPILSEVGPALEQILAEQGIQIPDPEEAVWTLLRVYIGDIASGAVPPAEGMRRVIEDVYDAAQLDKRTNEYMGDSHGLEKLIGAYYDYDDIEERAAIDALDRHMVELASDWLRDNADD